jgi:hypothetical protein
MDQTSQQLVGPEPTTLPDEPTSQLGQPRGWPAPPGASPDARLMPPQRLLPPVPPPPNRYVRVPSFPEPPE